MTHLTQRSIEQYKQMDTYNESGGIEVARTEERLAENHRRPTARAGTIDDGG
jgi:hypothetical protein